MTSEAFSRHPLPFRLRETARSLSLPKPVLVGEITSLLPQVRSLGHELMARFREHQREDADELFREIESLGTEWSPAEAGNRNPPMIAIERLRGTLASLGNRMERYPGAGDSLAEALAHLEIRLEALEIHWRIEREHRQPEWEREKDKLAQQYSLALFYFSLGREEGTLRPHTRRSTTPSAPTGPPPPAVGLA